MTNRAGIHAVRNFWEQVWQAPQDYEAIDELVVENFERPARLMIGCTYGRYAPVNTPNDLTGLKCLKFDFRHDMTVAPETP